MKPLPTSEEPPIKKITIRLYRDDIDTVRQMYPNVGYNYAIRRILRDHCNILRARMAETLGMSEEEATRLERESQDA